MGRTYLGTQLGAPVFAEVDRINVVSAGLLTNHFFGPRRTPQHECAANDRDCYGAL